MSQPVDKSRTRSATIQVAIKEVDKKLLKRDPVRAPDGGYGWVVVLASFFCNIIVDGVIFSFGVFLPEISNDLQVSKGATSWVGSLQTGFYLIAGKFLSCSNYNGNSGNNCSSTKVLTVSTHHRAVRFLFGEQVRLQSGHHNRRLHFRVRLWNFLLCR